MRRIQAILSVLLLLAATGCGLTPRQQTTIAGDALSVAVDAVVDAHARGVISDSDFAGKVAPAARVAHAAWLKMDQHADEPGAALALSPWSAAYRQWVEEYRRVADARSRTQSKPAALQVPAITSPAISPDDERPGQP